MIYRNDLESLKRKKKLIEMIKKYLWTVCFHMLHFLYLYVLFVGKLVNQRQRVFETPLLGLGPRYFFTRYPGRWFPPGGSVTQRFTTLSYP